MINNPDLGKENIDLFIETGTKIPSHYFRKTARLAVDSGTETNHLTIWFEFILFVKLPLTQVSPVSSMLPGAHCLTAAFCP